MLTRDSTADPLRHLEIAKDPKGPFRTKKTTAIAKIVKLLRHSVFTTPPKFTTPQTLLERENVCNSQETGVRTRYAAIVNHPAVLKKLRVVNLLRVLFLVRRGPLGNSTTDPLRCPLRRPLRRPLRCPLPSPPVRCPFKTGRLRWGDGLMGVLVGVSVGVLVAVLVGTCCGTLCESTVCSGRVTLTITFRPESVNTARTEMIAI